MPARCILQITKKVATVHCTGVLVSIIFMCDNTPAACKAFRDELDIAKNLFNVGTVLNDLETGAIEDLTDDEPVPARDQFTQDFDESASTSSDISERPSDACIGTQ